MNRKLVRLYVKPVFKVVHWSSCAILVEM